jgi:hypothetical protein
MDTDKYALLTAVFQRKLKLVRILLDGGMDVNYQSYDGKTPLMIACCFLQENDEGEKRDTFIKLLLFYKANPNIQDIEGRTALMYAFKHVLSPDIVKIILDNGGDPHIRDKNGRDVFSYIKTNIWPKYAKYLKPYVKDKVQTSWAQRIEQDSSDTPTCERQRQNSDFQICQQLNITEDSSSRVGKSKLQEKQNNNVNGTAHRRHSIQLGMLQTNFGGLPDSSGQRNIQHTQIHSNMSADDVRVAKHEPEIESHNCHDNESLEDLEQIAPLAKYRSSRSNSLKGVNAEIPNGVHLGRRRSLPTNDVSLTLEMNASSVLTTDVLKHQESESEIEKKSCIKKENIKVMACDISSVDRNILKHPFFKMQSKLPPIK